MAHLTISEIIKLGDISTYLSGNYIDEGKVYGDRLSQDMNRTIAMVTDAVRWEWAAFPDVAEVRAVGFVNIDSIGDPGDIITVYVQDPQYGTIILGSYTQSDTDMTAADIALGLATNMQLNTYGYQIVYSAGQTSITIIANEGSGANINNSNHLYVVITPSTARFISTEVPIRIAAQNNNNLITED